MFKITPEVLKEAGYRFHAQPLDRPYCEGVWQKLVRRSDERQLYAVEIRLWNWPDGHKSVGAKSCMYLNEDDGFWIEQMVREATDLESVEDFFRRTYELLGCIPDPVNS